MGRKFSKYNIRAEFLKHKKDKVPFHKGILRVVNIAMPIVQKSNSPYEKWLDIKEVSLTHCKAELIRPKGSQELPCMVYYHGGGFVIKASRMHRNLVREYAYQANMTVLFVDYRLAPRYPYPLPFQDCYEAYLWATERFGNTKLYVGGDHRIHAKVCGYPFMERKAESENVGMLCRERKSA